MSDYLVVVNAAAGGAEREAVAAACAVLGAHGEVEIRETARREDCAAAVGALDGRTLVVAGGDGSVQLAVRELRRAGLLGTATVGIVPLGTGNDLARGIGLPLEPPDAAEVVVRGVTRSLDVLVDDGGGLVVNAVHAGLGAEAALQASTRKDGLGALAYPVGALVAAVREEGWRLDVTVDGEAVRSADEPVLMVGVSNAPSIGGGARLCPLAVPDDGLLDVVVVGAVGAGARAAFGVALQRGRHLDRDDVVHRRGRRVDLRGGPVRYNADGEVSEPVAARSYRVEPATWQVLAPPRPPAG